MIKFEHHPIFPSLVSIFDLSECIDLPKVNETISNYGKTIEHGLVSNGKSSWETGYENFIYEQKLFNLNKDIQECIDKYTEEAGLDKNIIVQSWFNVLETGGYVRRHRHEKSIISGAFYPLADETSCPLYLENPVNTFRLTETPTKETIYNNPRQGIQPKTGMLVLFPSWMYHSTDINQGNKRITISFNTVDETMINVIKGANIG